MNKTIKKTFIHFFKDAPAMLKNLKREDIEAAIKNMPPELREMAEGMGKISLPKLTLHLKHHRGAALNKENKRWMAYHL